MTRDEWIELVYGCGPYDFGRENAALIVDRVILPEMERLTRERDEARAVALEDVARRFMRMGFGNLAATILAMRDRP